MTLLSAPDPLLALARQVTDLPPLPQVLVDLMRLLQTPDYSERQCVALVEHDQALAAHLLRLANSAFYGVPGRVGSIGDALRILGVRTVSGALTAVALRKHLRVEACPAFDMDGYWRHTMATAMAARALALRLDRDADEAFLAGLLHDIGQLVLAAFSPEAAGRAIARARHDGLGADEAERRELGFSHPQLGAQVARHWHFPDAICRAIEWHHQPREAAAGERISVSGLVCYADRLAHAMQRDGGLPAAASGQAVACPHLGLDDDTLRQLMAETEQAVHDLCAEMHAP